MQQSKLALDDIFQGITSWRIWLLLSWQDIKLRYRRSQLGPFWITLSMAITIYTMGFLYGHLFKQNLTYYFPFLASGMLIWAMISTIINESTASFIEGEGYLKQIKTPFSIYIMRVVSRNFIIFLHNVVVLIPIMIYFHVPIGWHIFMAFFGISMILLNGFIFGVLFAMLGARYRDIAVIIQNLIQVAFFLTPIMWMPQLLAAKYAWIFKINPFAQFIEIARAPLIGQSVSWYTINFNIACALIGACVVFFVFKSFRRRIVYWI